MPTPSSSWWRFAAAILLLQGCGAAAEPGQEAAPPSAIELRMQRAPAGELVLVAVRQSPETRGSRLTALQGRIRFDPVAWRYAGQVRSDSAFVLVEASAEPEGLLRFAAFAPRGLRDEAVVLAFEPRGSAGSGLDFRPEVSATLDGARHREAGAPIPARDGDIATHGIAEYLTLAQWIQLSGQRPAPSGGHGIPHLAGEGRVYGDADLNGSPDINDALLIAQVSVQTAPLLADPLTDVAIAGNVAPANLPGLGEPEDDNPPGREADGSLLVNVLDALEVANFTVSLPAGVVGQAIPGHDVPGTIDTLPAVLAADLVLGRGALHRMVGRVIVARGVTLRINAGARLEAIPSADLASSGQLVVRQGGRIEVLGTRLLPVVMTCDPSARAPGCWRGLVVNGASLLNNDGVSGNVFGCPILNAPDGAGIYGGCLVQDDSGILRYLRIEFAGRTPTGPVPGAGLALNGVGAGTTIDSIQVYGSSSTGVFVSGGTSRVRNLVISGSAGSGLRWADGWQGKIQQMLILHGAQSAMPAVEGTNYAMNPDAGPRSAPQIWNATVVGTEPGGASRPPAVRFRTGSAGRLRNAIVMGFSVGLEIDGDASCARASDSLDVGSSIFHRNTLDADDDADCIDELAYVTAASRGNRFLDPQLSAPFVTSYDLRPIPGAAAGTGSTPPSDGFFDPTMQYTGGVATANQSWSNVPWYAGWTRQTDIQLLSLTGASPSR